jgi:hypothetical protein
MDAAAKAWDVIHLDRERFGTAELNALRDGAVAAVLIDHFYDEATCRAIAENVTRLGLSRIYTGDNLEASFTGLVATEFLGRKDAYFAAVPDANADRRRLLGDGADPWKL